MVSFPPDWWKRKDEERREEDESSENQRVRNQLQAEKDAMIDIEKASDVLLNIIRDISAETKRLRRFARDFPEGHPVNLKVNRSAQALEESNMRLADLKNKMFSSSRTIRYLVR